MRPGDVVVIGAFDEVPDLVTQCERAGVPEHDHSNGGRGDLGSLRRRAVIKYLCTGSVLSSCNYWVFSGREQRNGRVAAAFCHVTAVRWAVIAAMIRDT